MRVIPEVRYMHLKLMTGPSTFEMQARTKHCFAWSARSPPYSCGSTAMSESVQTTEVAATAGSSSDSDLLTQTADAVRAAGSVLRERFGDVVSSRTREGLMSGLAGNDDAALEVLRPALARLRPDARFVEDELAGGALPPGEWWV